MSNEEIVARIQAGEQELMGELWGQVERLVKWKAKQVMMALNGRCGVEFDDLHHSGFPAMVAAVETYNPKNSSFSTWFMFYLKTAFEEVTGYRTKKGQNEPLNTALSLSTPIGKEEDDGTLALIIPDPKASATMENIEEEIWYEQLHSALEGVLGELPENQSLVLRHRYYAGQTLTATGRELEMSAEEVRKLEGQGLKALRHHKLAQKIRPFYDFDYYAGTGLQSFKHTGTSIQERYLIRMEQGKEKQSESQNA